VSSIPFSEQSEMATVDNGIIIFDPADSTFSVYG
jgi:hypothetical protein